MGEPTTRGATLSRLAPAQAHGLACGWCAKPMPADWRRAKQAGRAREQWGHVFGLWACAAQSCRVRPLRAVAERPAPGEVVQLMVATEEVRDARACA